MHRRIGAPGEAYSKFEVRLPDGLRGQLERHAAQDDRPLAVELRVLLVEALAARERAQLLALERGVTPAR